MQFDLGDTAETGYLYIPINTNMYVPFRKYLFDFYAVRCQNF